MGSKSSKHNKKPKHETTGSNNNPIKTPASKQNDIPKNYQIINDNFSSYSDLEAGLRKAGLESSQLIVGIDFTKSNTWQGGMPYFQYENLHTISHVLNPYQQVLTIMCQALSTFDDDQMIDAYGFGDQLTRNETVFPFQSKTENGYVIDQSCYQLNGVLECYNRIAPYVQMSGPTSFAPIIRKAIELVSVRNEYHILLIIADGEVNDMNETIQAIVDASNYPLSIICVGVGKGPWDRMEKMDDNIPQRKFDNFQFVDFYAIMNQCENEVVEFAKHAMMEVPDQYTYIRNNILNKPKK